MKALNTMSTRGHIAVQNDNLMRSTKSIYAVLARNSSFRVSGLILGCSVRSPVQALIADTCLSSGVPMD